MCDVVMGRPVCWHGGPPGDRLLSRSMPYQTATIDGANQHPTGLASMGESPR